MKIIILTSRFGMGHFSAAKILEQQLKKEAPQHQTIFTDFYKMAFPNHYKKIYSSYTRLMLRGGKLINSAYKSTVNDAQGLPKSLKLPEHFLFNRLSDYLDREDPDVIVTTYSLASYLVDSYQSLHNSSFRHITCITDVGVHNVWINPGTALYLVACEETRAALLRRGVDKEKIVISGIPVNPAFHEAAAATKKGCNKELLIMGGGLGMLPEHKSFYKKLSQIADLHTTVVCAKNYRLQEKLQAADLPNLTVLGCIDDVPQKMAAADLLMSKPGGISTFEAIEAELPLLLIPPSMEQEIKNANFVLRHGLGKQLSGKEISYANKIDLLIHDDLKLASMRHKMHRLRCGFDKDAIIRFIENMETDLRERNAV